MSVENISSYDVCREYMLINSLSKKLFCNGSEQTTKTISYFRETVCSDVLFAAWANENVITFRIASVTFSSGSSQVKTCTVNRNFTRHKWIWKVPPWFVIEWPSTWAVHPTHTEPFYVTVHSNFFINKREKKTDWIRPFLDSLTVIHFSWTFFHCETNQFLFILLISTNHSAI